MAGTVSFLVANVTADKAIRTVTINFTTDSSVGTLPATSMGSVPVPSTFAVASRFTGQTTMLSEALLGYHITAAKITGGATPPENGAGFTLVDSDGLDWLLGKLAALTGWTAQKQSIDSDMTIDRALTLTFSPGSSPVNSATGTIVLYFKYDGVLP